MTDRDRYLIDELAAAARDQSKRITATAEALAARLRGEHAAPPAGIELANFAAATEALAAAAKADQSPTPGRPADKLFAIALAGLDERSATKPTAQTSTLSAADPVGDDLARRRRRRQLLVSAGGLAAAALIFLVVRPRSIANLPDYELGWEGGLAEKRLRNREPVEHRRLRLDPTGQLRLTLQPESDTGRDVEAAAFVRVGGVTRRLALTFAASDTGSFVGVGPLDALTHLRGTGELVIVVRRHIGFSLGASIASFADLASGVADQGPGWRRLRVDAEIVPPR